MYVIVLLALIAGCDYRIDRGIETADIYRVYNQSRSMLLAEARFETKYDVISGAFVDAEVFWTDTKCPYKDILAVVVDGICYHGIMWNCGEMYVSLKYTVDDHTCPTSLTHEFSHCLLMNAGWEDAGGPCAFANDPNDTSWIGDSDHSDTDFWLFMTKVRREICDRGW